MWYKTFLPKLHSVLKPRTYVEIGIRHGYSLSLSPKAKKIAIDPNFSQLDMHFDVTNVTFFQCTSDEFFHKHDLFELFPDGYDLAYIDGMHLFEYALRDFINLERYSNPNSVILVDDVLPRNTYEASRNPTGDSWTGDVWKLTPCLREYREELVSSMILAEMEPTGALIISMPDAFNDSLSKHYENILTKYVHDCQQMLPDATILESAVSPEIALEQLKSMARGAC